jgi:Protein of unknown function (DUF901).
MNREYWLDGFNLFHHWDSTKGLLRPDSGYDIVRAIERSIRILSRHLGGKTRMVTVYLDGGLERRETRNGGMRIRYAGPGRKADDRMADDVAELGASAKMVTAVSNDRELKGRLYTLGAACLGVGEFLAMVEGKKENRINKKRGPGSGQFQSKRDIDEVMREKTRTLSEFEVQAWLEFFGAGEEESGG